MKRTVLFVIFMLVLNVFSAEAETGYRFWERMSLFFDEFSVMDDGTLHGRLQGFDIWGFHMRIGEHTSHVSSRERPFVLRPGEELSFWRPEVPSSSICVLPRDNPQIGKMDLPPQLQNDRLYLRIRTVRFEVYVGTTSQVAYILPEKTCIDFPLPFKTVWSDRKDYDLWVSGVDCRYRMKRVGKMMKAETQLATSLYRHFSTTNLLALVGKPYAEGVTNILVSANSGATNVVSNLVDSLIVRVAGTNSQFKVFGFSFVTQDDKIRRSRRYRFDSEGHLVYGWRTDRTNENGAPGREVLDMPFEYDSDGVLRRIWTPGSNPLMIDKGNKLYFTGDRELLIKFRQDVHQSLEGLPRLK